MATTPNGIGSIDNLTIDSSLNDNTKYQNPDLEVLSSTGIGVGIPTTPTPTTDGEEETDSYDEPIEYIEGEEIPSGGSPTDPDTTPGSGIGAVVNTGREADPNKLGPNESFEYWTMGELVTFQMEAALGARWSTIATQAMMDGLSLANSLADFVSAGADIVGELLGGLFSDAYEITSMLGVPEGTFVYPLVGVGKDNLQNEVRIPPTPGTVPRPWNPATEYRQGWDHPTGGYGARRAHAGPGQGHCGVDMMGARGRKCVAPFSGTVFKKVNNESPGKGGGSKWGIISDDGIWACVGMHAITGSVFTGDYHKNLQDHVNQGDVVALNGSSGNAAWGSPHIHFELYKLDGKTKTPSGSAYVDPGRWLKGAHILDEIDGRLIDSGRRVENKIVMAKILDNSQQW